jgi:hypothetical protein
MSTQVNTYVMFGVLLPRKNCPLDLAAHSSAVTPYKDDPYGDRANPKDGITVLDDSLSGEYIAVGHVVAKTGCDAHFSGPIEVPVHAKNWWSWGATIAAIVSELGYDTRELQLGWFVVPHYR